MKTNLPDAMRCPLVKQREPPSAVLCEMTGGGGALPAVGPLLPPPASPSGQCPSAWQGHRMACLVAALCLSEAVSFWSLLPVSA